MNFFSNPFILEDVLSDQPLPQPAEPTETEPADAAPLSLLELRIELNRGVDPSG